ncbi:ABC transporter substrate-binding protein [Streptomyces chartreusis]|uniref:ABC transporter substrate-binding protein n=1 Tax=Streptomyces chartreusis TaxID=1969 RepID=UPI0036617734
MTRATRRRHVLTAASGIAVLSLITACSADTQSSTSGPDNGTKLTMWARNTSDNLAQKIVAKYNATHKNQIELSTLPNETYQQKVAAAAASGGLPDILASDVVYSPNYVKQNLFRDVSEKVKQLPHYKDLASAHMKAASAGGKIYGTPFILDMSLIHYNKDLFKKAGLDPSRGPKSFEEIYEDSEAIRKSSGGDTYGFYFGGNCAGCNAYTMFGNLAAAGEPPFEDDGAKANFDTPAMKATLDLYKRLWDKKLVPPAARSEDGTTWANLFNEGKIGILPRGTSNLANLEDATFQHGVAMLPAPDGTATSGFVGGDVAAISSTTKNFDQAWNFLAWTLSDDAQVEVIAKSGSMPSRVDLANNKYSSADPNLVAAIKGLATGYTPSAAGYGNAINNPNGPWLKMVRDYIFKGNPDALKKGQADIQSALDETQ